ncbi:MAG: hypothetical protein JO122_17990 [Acetobacteraceae bacterium]|nr:hypothetical protein [Acetobacteraceae bacterium]
MLLATYLTGSLCVAATGAWYLRRGIFAAEARMIMLRMGLYLQQYGTPILLYTAISYTVFRGKVRPAADHY